MSTKSFSIPSDTSSESGESDSSGSNYHDSLSISDAEHLSPIPPTPVSVAHSTTSSAAERLAHLQDSRRSAVPTNPDGTIPNRPPEDPRDPDEEATEKALNAELVGDDELSARELAKCVRNALFDLFVVTPLMLVPSLLVFFFANFKLYWPSENKGPDGINDFMEFIRYNTFAAAAYALFAIFDVFSLALPEAGLMMTDGAGKNAAMYSVRRQLRALIVIRKYVTFAAWLLALLPLGGYWLYESSLLTPFSLLAEILTAEKKKEGHDGGKESQETSHKEAIKHAESLVFHQQVESFLLAAAVFAFIIAIEKYLVECIRLRFHKKAFSDRIIENNTKFSLLGRLYEAVTKGKPKILARNTPTRQREYLDSSYESSMQLTSIHRAKTVASTLFRSLVKPNADSLLVEDFEPFIAEYQDAFAMFDPNKTGKVTASDFEAVVVDVYEHRVNLIDSMVGNGRIVRRLDVILLTFALFIASAVTTPVFDLGIAKILSAVAVLTASVAFIFHSAAKSVFDAFIFVFVQHAFDVGDRVIIDDTPFVVEKIEIINTTLCKDDGTTVYIPNASLAGKTIVNVRRSKNQFERVSLSLKSGTSTQAIYHFLDVLQAKLAEEVSHFTGKVTINDFDKISADKDDVDLTIVAQIRGNFQNNSRHNVTKSILMSKIEEALNETQIRSA